MPRNEVSVGYGTQARDRIAGSISTISLENWSDRTVTRVEQLLEGRVPGLHVLRVQGGGFTVRIRGVGTLLGSSEPLLVIDDVPVTASGFSSAFAAISPHDIVRIDVLKDAGSAAVYGIRGANGVIIVTTRRGR